MIEFKEGKLWDIEEKNSYEIQITDVRENGLTVLISEEAYSNLTDKVIGGFIEEVFGIYYKYRCAVTKRGEKNLSAGGKLYSVDLSFEECLSQVQIREDIKVRTNLLGECSFIEPLETFPIEILDLSAGGCQFACERMLERDDICKVVFKLPDKKAVIISDVRILRVRILDGEEKSNIARYLGVDSQNKLYSYGCCFERLRRDMETQVRAYVFRRNVERRRM